MIGNDSEKKNESTSANLSHLLQSARELVLQCRAAPSLSTGMYDELIAPPLQRPLDQLFDASTRLANSTSVLGGSSPRAYINIQVIYLHLW